MPLYDYTCQSCGKAFEFLARTLSDRPKACPACGGSDLKKGFSTFAAKVSSGSVCPHEGTCAHSHGAGCGCGCCH
ncbi:MAG: zinc ribbon domain-containing protein [Candidatus Spyradenecus sp.]